MISLILHCITSRLSFKEQQSSQIVMYNYLHFFQLSLAARVVRDAPETPKAEETDTKSFNLNEALTNLTQGLQKALSKDNVDVSVVTSASGQNLFFL